PCCFICWSAGSVTFPSNTSPPSAKREMHSTVLAPRLTPETGLNDHSFIRMPVTAAAAVRRLRQGADAIPKRDAILRAATDVFAERGYFNAQVADVARAA